MRLLDIRLLDPLEILLESDGGSGDRSDCGSGGEPGGGSSGDGAATVDAVRTAVRVRAEQWAGRMCDGDDTTAAYTAVRLVATLYPGDRAFDPPTDWWGTPLGQVVARRIGHPAAESVSYATAGAMLGISRQGVHDLVKRGRLPGHPDGGVPSAAVRDRLRCQGET